MFIYLFIDIYSYSSSISLFHYIYDVCPFASKGSIFDFTVIRRTSSGARLHEILRGSVFSDSIWLQLQPNLTIYTISKRNWGSK